MPPQPPPTPGDFEKVFQEHYAPLLYWFRRQRLDPETSEELTQDTMLAAYRALYSFRGDSSHRTWLLQIARNLFRNYLRDQRTQKRKAKLVMLDARQASDGPPLEISDDSSPPQDEQLIDREREGAVRSGVLQLPPQMRQCLELRLGDLKYREIASIMGVSVETVKSHLHQARSRLREALRPDPGWNDSTDGGDHA